MVPRIGLPLQPEPGANRTMRRILVSAAVLLVVGVFLALTLGASGGSSSPTYKIELDNAFGLVTGADFKVAGVISGSIKTIDLCSTDPKAHCENPLHALANNSKDVQRFIVEANRASTISATQAPSIEATWKKLPAFLEQLRPAMQKLGAAADAQDPVFQNLNQASSNLTTFFHELAPFSHESIPSFKSLGQAAKVGKPAIEAATPLVKHLNQFA